MILDQYHSHIFWNLSYSHLIIPNFLLWLIIPNFLLWLKLLQWDSYMGILTKVESTYTTLLNTQCWKLELLNFSTENVNYSFLSYLDKIWDWNYSWHVRKDAVFVICSQTAYLKFKVELFYAGQHKITKWKDFFLLCCTLGCGYF